MSLRRVFSRPQSAGQAANTYSDSEVGLPALFSRHHNARVFLVWYKPPWPHPPPPQAHAVRFATPAERVIEQLTADLLDAQRFIAKLQQVSWCGGWSCGRLPGPARVPCSHCAIARPTRQAQQDSETQIRKLRGLGDYKAAHDRLAKELSQVCMTGVPAIRPCLARGPGGCPSDPHAKEHTWAPPLPPYRVKSSVNRWQPSCRPHTRPSTTPKVRHPGGRPWHARPLALPCAPAGGLVHFETLVRYEQLFR